MDQLEQKLPSILTVKDLAVSYETRKGSVNAVRNVSFEINRRQAFGLVGESGCGKSTVAYSLVNSLGRNGRIVDGQIIFQGQDLVGRTQEELRRLRGNDISMVFQDPQRALNPSLRIGDQVSEVLTAHRRDVSREEAYERSIKMLKRVYMPDAGLIMERYPHQLSGGQQQRVIIAMALLNDPALLIMDEPTTALDVTVEAVVLDLIQELRHEFETAILYITHNLGVVARICDDVGVMYAGTIVERASVRQVYAQPSHPYTRALLQAAPRLGSNKAESYLHPIRGRVPSPHLLPPACLFEPRCDFAQQQCRREVPTLRKIDQEYFVRCHFAEEVRAATNPRQAQKVTLTLPEPAENSKPALLDVKQLKTYYQQSQKSLASLFGLGQKQFVKALDGVSFEVPAGATLGVVGESGCGKSTLVKTIVGLQAATAGDMKFLGIDIAEPVTSRRFDLIKELQMVFQNPDSTLNPSFSVGHQIARPLKRFTKASSREIKSEVINLLKAVRLDATYYNRLPRQLSGGEKQRVAIARAIATHPQLIICDEPVSALDVSVQAAILNLLLDLQAKFGITMVFISHDLSVVRFFSDYVAVMYLGQFVEFGPAEKIYLPPYHPYTESLLAAVPIPDPNIQQDHIRLEGTVPSPLNPPKGCPFHTRCPRRSLLPNDGRICTEERPPIRETGDGHKILCHIPLEQLESLDAVIQMR